MTIDEQVLDPARYVCPYARPFLAKRGAGMRCSDPYASIPTASATRSQSRKKKPCSRMRREGTKAEIVSAQSTSFWAWLGMPNVGTHDRLERMLAFQVRRRLPMPLDAHLALLHVSTIRSVHMGLIAFYGNLS
jgi:hypothetical protein